MVASSSGRPTCHTCLSWKVNTTRRASTRRFHVSRTALPCSLGQNYRRERICVRALKKGKASAEESRAYQRFDSLLGSQESKSEHFVCSNHSSDTQRDQDEAEQAYSRAERKFLRQSGGLFAGHDSQAPRSLRKAKEKYMTPEMQSARRQALLELMADKEKPPDLTPEPEMELLVQRPRGSFSRPKQLAERVQDSQPPPEPKPLPTLAVPPSRSADALREHIQSAGMQTNDISDQPAVDRSKPSNKMAFAYEAMKAEGFTEEEINGLLETRGKNDAPASDLPLASRPVRQLVLDSEKQPDPGEPGPEAEPVAELKRPQQCLAHDRASGESALGGSQDNLEATCKNSLANAISTTGQADERVNDSEAKNLLANSDHQETPATEGSDHQSHSLRDDEQEQQTSSDAEPKPALLTPPAQAQMLDRANPSNAETIQDTLQAPETNGLDKGILAVHDLQRPRARPAEPSEESKHPRQQVSLQRPHPGSKPMPSEEEKQLHWNQAVKEAQIAMEVKQQGKSTAFSVLFFKRGGAMVQSIDYGFQGFLPRRSMGRKTARHFQEYYNTYVSKRAQANTSANYNPASVRGLKIQAFVLEANPPQEDEQWLAQGSPRRQVILSELPQDGSNHAGKGATAFPKEVAAVLESSAGAVVEAVVREDKTWGSLVEFDVKGPNNTRTRALGAINLKNYSPPGQRPQVGAILKAVILRVNPENLHTYLSMRLSPETQMQQVALEGNIPEAERVCLALAERGFEAALGQRQEGLAFAPELQVFLRKKVESGDAVRGDVNGLQKFSAAIRSGNETQDLDLAISSKLDWTAMRKVITEVVEQTLSESDISQE